MTKSYIKPDQLRKLAKYAIVSKAILSSSHKRVVNFLLRDSEEDLNAPELGVTGLKGQTGGNFFDAMDTLSKDD